MVRISFIFFFIQLFLFSLVAEESVINDLHKYAKDRNFVESEKFKKHFSEGQSLFERQNFSKATNEFVSASLENPNHPVPIFYLALSLFASKEYQLGGETLRHAIGLYPYWSKVQLNLIDFFPKSFEFSYKKNEFKRVLLQGSHPENTYLLFGFLCQFSEDKQNAEMAYRLVLAKNHTHLEAQKLYEIVTGEKANSFYSTQKQIAQLAMSYQKQELFAQASSEWATSFSFYPENPEVLYNLCYCLCSVNKFNEGAKTLLMAFRLSPSHFQEQFQITTQFGKRKYLENIISNLEQTIQSRKDDLDLIFLWSYFSFLSGEKSRVKIAIENLRIREYHPQEINLFWQKFLEGPVSSNNNIDEREEPDEKPNESEILDKNESQEKSVKNDFSNLPVGLLKGIGEFQNQNYEDAATSFAQQIIKNPQNSLQSQWFLGMAHIANGKYEYTYKILRQTVVNKTLTPLDWEKYYHSPKTFQNHIVNLNNHVKKFPEDLEALAVLGYLMATTNKKAQAKIIFERLLQREPNDEFSAFVLQLLKN